MTEESGSPLLRLAQPMEDADDAPPSPSQTLPLKVLACLLAPLLCDMPSCLLKFSPRQADCWKCYVLHVNPGALSCPVWPRLQVARLRCALARYLTWEVNASRDFRYAVRHSSSMVHQPCLLQVGTMLKQAGQDHLATTDERASLLDAIQAGPQSGGQQQLSLQVCSSCPPPTSCLARTLLAQLPRPCHVSDLILCCLSLFKGEGLVKAAELGK